MIIYKAIFPNGRVYVGKTSGELSLRVRRHIHAAARGSSRFHGAIRKYGVPQFSVVCRCCSESVANWIEQSYISLWRTELPYGYNGTAGGEGGSVRVRDVRLRMSAGQRTRRAREKRADGGYTPDETMALFILNARASRSGAYRWMFWRDLMRMLI